MGKLIRLEQALASDSAPLKASPAWTNTAVGTINGRVVLHAGGGRLDGTWHRQDSDEFLLVVRGALVVEFDAGPLTAGPGEGIFIAAEERHRASVPEGCLLLSVEGVAMRRFE
jgi:mannose-6-phosphate isomerase-like protein (cupin superfamily)